MFDPEPKYATLTGQVECVVLRRLHYLLSQGAGAMKDQMTIGRIVGLKHQQHIQGSPLGGVPELIVVPPGGLYKILGIEGDKIRVQGIEK
jgi:hypothetical protein